MLCRSAMDVFRSSITQGLIAEPLVLGVVTPQAHVILPQAHILQLTTPFIFFPCRNATPTNVLINSPATTGCSEQEDGLLRRRTARWHGPAAAFRPSWKHRLCTTPTVSPATRACWPCASPPSRPCLRQKATYCAALPERRPRTPPGPFSSAMAA